MPATDVPLAPGTGSPPQGKFVTRPGQPDPYLAEEQPHEEVQKHPLLVWTSLSPGCVVSIRGQDARAHVGRVEARTSDGLVIWIRDELNEVKPFHFHQCQTVRVINSQQ